MFTAAAITLMSLAWLHWAKHHRQLTPQPIGTASK